MSLTTERRPFNDRDRETALRLAATQRPNWFSVVGWSLFLVVAAGVLAPVFAFSAIMLLDGLGLKVDMEWTLRLFVTFAVLVLAWEAWQIYKTVAQARRLVSQIESDIAEGVVEVLKVETTATQRPLGNDQVRSPALLHDLGDKTFLFTQGTHLQDLVTSGKFPCRKFTLVRLPTARLTLDIVPEGDPLQPAVNNKLLDSVHDGDVLHLP